MRRKAKYVTIIALQVIFVVLSVGCNSRNHQNHSGIHPDNLRCEYQKDPLGIDNKTPRFSWICKADSPLGRSLSQTAYHLIVSSSEDLLAKDHGDIWDSGKIISDKSVNINYSSSSLSSRSRYYWKVRVYDQDDRVSGWSNAAFWETGFLSHGDWKASWISWQPAPSEGFPPDPHGSVSPWLRKTFSLPENPGQARMYVNVAGYFELYVNGEKVGRDVLSPAVSDYLVRSFYITYDIGSYLKKGTNCIALWLGRGWYDPEARPTDPDRGPGPRLRAQCEILTGGKQVFILTDTSWKATASPYTTIGLYEWCKFHGESYDATLENPDWNLASYDDSKWEKVHQVPAPSPVNQAQPCPLNRIGKHIKPESITDLGGGVYEIDFGTNLTGGFRFRFPRMEKGKTVTFHYADGKKHEINNAGIVNEGEPDVVRGSYKDLVYLDKDSSPHAYQTMQQYDTYFSSDNRDAFFETKFNYHGFRYVIVDKLPSAPVPEDAEATLIETDLEASGDFACSNELFNDIYSANLWTLRCLNAGCFLVDCPHRERMGWGDHQVSVETCMMNFGMQAFYQKWMQDWRDVQDPVTGMMPATAPHPHFEGGGPAWKGMHQALNWRVYLYYGDKQLLADNYNACRLFVDNLEDSFNDHGIFRNFGGKWDYVYDWVAPGRGMDTENWPGNKGWPPPTQTKSELFNNCYRVYLWDQLVRMASVLGMDEEAGFCRARLDTLRPLVHKTFFDKENQHYVSNEQVNLVMPLVAGIVPDQYRDIILDKLESNILNQCDGHLSTGMWGSYFLIQYLQEIGRNDLIYSIMNQKTYPGWGFMLSQGATTFWEQWNGYYSRIHSCLTSPGSWFHQGLAGIRPDETTPGFKKIIIKPAIVGELEWVKASYESGYGLVKSSWTKTGEGVVLDVTIPANTTATVYLPTEDYQTITEGGKSISESNHIQFIRSGEGQAVFELGSGSYHFKNDKPGKESNN